MSGYTLLLTRNKADKELSASASLARAHTAAKSHIPCAPTAGRQLQTGGRRVRETVLVVFKNGWQNEAFPLKSFADVRDRHKCSHADIPPVRSCFLPLSCPPLPLLWQGVQCPSSENSLVGLSPVSGTRTMSKPTFTTYMHTIQNTHTGAEFY